MFEAVEQQPDEQDAADDAHDQFDGQLIGCDDHPGQHIADQDEQRPEQGRIHQRAADLVPLEHGDDVGHDQPDVGDRPHDHHHRGGNHGRDGQPHEQHQLVGHAQVLRKVLSHSHDVEVVGKHKRQRHQGQGQPDQLVIAGQHHRKVPHQPGRKGLGHLVLIGEVVGDPSDDVAEHDAHQRHHHRVLELDALDEPDKDPGAQHGGGKGKDGPAPQGRLRHEQQRQQDAELRRRDGGPGGGRNEFVHAELLHDEAGHAHPHPGAEDGQQSRQAGDKKDFHLLRVAAKEAVQVQVDDPHKQGYPRQDQQQDGQRGRQLVFCDGCFLL